VATTAQDLHLIDVHTHIGEVAPRKGQTAGQLIKRMGQEGIERSVVLSIENPEETYSYVLSKHVIRSCRRCPSRLIPFCCVDPRRGRADTSTDFLGLIERHVRRGAKGFGEYLAGLPVDDPRSMKIFEACGVLGIPVLLHMDNLRNTDSIGLPGFEKVLGTLPQTIFIAHGPGWWREISSVVDGTVNYPKDPVREGGRAKELLAGFDNLYGDLSAGSGHNALNRDPAHAQDFLNEFAGKLLFGTDCIYPGQELPIVDFIVKADVSKKVKLKIANENVLRILGIPTLCHA
jgi:predicted TIM-barrel fold metal-dependent hydrolase